MESLRNALFGNNENDNENSSPRQPRQQPRRGRRRGNNNNNNSPSSSNSSNSNGRRRGGWGEGGQNEGVMSWMEQFMTQVAEQASQEQEQPSQVPPASEQALRQLPSIEVTAQDLADENNRECCICLEPHKIGDRVTRLPCAHIFHPNCIEDWLMKHCTCPICRFELATDDPQYEAGRVARMRQRKPRYAEYELERMSSRELHQLVQRLRITGLASPMEKADVISKIISSGRIEVISAPEPVSYRLSELRAMGISKLKQAMHGAGVFFNPRDVVEKEDMIRIFLNSGRVDLERDEEDDNLHGDDLPNESYDYIINHDIEPDSDDDIMETEESNVIGSRTFDTRSGHIVEVETAEDDELPPTSDNDAQEMFQTQETENITQTTTQNNPSDDQLHQVTDNFQQNHVPHTIPDHNHDTTQPVSNASVRTSYRNLYAAQSDSPSLASRSVAELRALAVRFDISFADCLEKREMVEKLARALG